MDEKTAQAAARALRGETWQSGGGIWLVIFHRSDGKVVVLSDEVVKLYKNRDAFEEDQVTSEIILH